MATRLLAQEAVVAASLTGTYTARSDKGSISLVLTHEPAGRLTGTLTSATGLRVRLDGRAAGELAEGSITDGRSRGVFAAQLDGDRLVLVLAVLGKDDEPDPSRALRLVLARVETPAAAATAPPAAPAPGAAAPATEASRPSVPPAVLAPAAREWDQRLRGQRLTQLSGYSSGGGGGGYNSRRDIDLCTGGEFLSAGSSSVSVYVPGATGGSARRNEDAGTWQIVTEGDVVGLELRSRSGGVTRYVLSRVDGKTFLGRTRTFVTPENDRCP